MAVPKKLWEAVRNEVCEDIEVHEDLDLSIHLHRLGYKIYYHETLKVGVKMRRIFEDSEQLMPNLMLWPQTLRKHGLNSWIFGWVGAVWLYIISWFKRIFRPSTN
jgi:hypothetical protein